MCLINCEIAEGLIPSEKIARITVKNGGREEVPVSQMSLRNKFLMVSEIGRENDHVLVELPRESMSGRWRVWVPASEVKGEK